jgi:hypothetical protein
MAGLNRRQPPLVGGMIGSLPAGEDADDLLDTVLALTWFDG